MLFNGETPWSAMHKFISPILEIFFSSSYHGQSIKIISLFKYYMMFDESTLLSHLEARGAAVWL